MMNDNINSSVLTKIEDSLETRPEVIKDIKPVAALGDLHGNSLKLVHFLIQHGVADLSKGDYEELYALYSSSDNIAMDEPSPQKEKFDQIIEILDKIEIKPENSPYFHFIGDELADRGKNDFYTLYILKKLHDGNIKFDICQSNHTHEFYVQHFYGNEPELIDIKIRQKQYCSSNIYPIQANSMCMMGTLIDQNIVSQEEVNNLVDVHSSKIKLISYSLSLKGITLYTHAPVDYTIIEAIANKLNVNYDDSSPIQLAKTIDKINIAYQKHLSEKTIKEIVSIHNTGEQKQEEDPIEFLVWNRNLNQINRENTHPKHHYEINYVHGHDSTDIRKTNVFNLDSEFGKQNNVKAKNPTFRTDECTSISQLVIKKLNEECQRYYQHLTNKQYIENDNGDSAIPNLELRNKVAIVRKLINILNDELQQNEYQNTENYNKNIINLFSIELKSHGGELASHRSLWNKYLVAFFRGIRQALSSYLTDFSGFHLASHGEFFTKASNLQIDDFNNEDSMHIRVVI